MLHASCPACAQAEKSTTLLPTQVWKLQPWLAEQAEAVQKELEELPRPHIGFHIRAPGTTAVQAPYPTLPSPLLFSLTSAVS